MGVMLYGDHVSLPGSGGVFRWLWLQHPSCSNPQKGMEGCMCRGCAHGGSCIPVWHKNNTTCLLWVFETLLGACTCQLVLTQG